MAFSIVAALSSAYAGETALVHSAALDRSEQGSPPPAQQAAGPCERGPTSMRMAGVDLDVTRCQLSLMGKTLGDKESEEAALAATLLLTRSDLAKSQEAQAKEASASAWWGSCVKDDVCVAWARGSATK